MSLAIQWAECTRSRHPYWLERWWTRSSKENIYMYRDSNLFRLKPREWINCFIPKRSVQRQIGARLIIWTKKTTHMVTMLITDHFHWDICFVPVIFLWCFKVPCSSYKSGSRRMYNNCRCLCTQFITPHGASHFKVTYMYCTEITSDTDTLVANIHVHTSSGVSSHYRI